MSSHVDLCYVCYTFLVHDIYEKIWPGRIFCDVDRFTHFWPLQLRNVGFGMLSMSLVCTCTLLVLEWLCRLFVFGI
jgi:hypothetical protein